MAIKLNYKALLFKKPELTLLALFIFTRFFSLFTYNHSFLNGIVTLLIIVLFIYVCIKNLSLAWLILVAELLLDGAGHFFEFKHLILRTWFLGIFAMFWLYKKIKERRLEILLPRPLVISLVILIIVIFWSILQGFIQQHTTLYILQDAILYFFILLFLPALEFDSPSNKQFFNIIKVFIIGTAFFSIITFFIYATGLGVLKDIYYHWFRNIVAGKITDLGQNFFRIVLPEQLFVVPLILVLASKLIKENKNKLIWFLIILLLTILILNFSRIYFVALAFGMIVLAYKNSFKEWLRISVLLLLSSIIIFVSLNLLVSKGHSWGGQILGVKISGATAPEAELSGAIRLAMLPDIFNTIKKHPFLGSGLGTTVSYADPLTKEIVTRTQFDWGYLEMWAELGLAGLIGFFSYIFILLFYLFKITYSSKENDNRGFLQGLFAGALSFFVINITTPALFQGFGILYFVFLLTLINNSKKEIL